MSIIYGIIAKDSKPLCEYSEYVGSISSVCIKAIAMCKEKQGVLTYEGYNMYYENHFNLIFLLMCEKGYPEEAVFKCIENIVNEFQKTFPSSSAYDNGPQYCLNKQFQQKLRMYMEKYNDPKNQKNKVDILKDQVLSMHRQVLDTADIVNERGEQINLIVSKSEQLSRDSYTFKKTAEKVKNIERWRKIKLYGTIILIFVIIIGTLYLLKRK